MQSLIAFLTLILSVLNIQSASAPGLVATSSAMTTPASEMHRVVRVVDGDTLIVSIDGKDATLRLIGLDTPEVVDPRRAVQCFGREASSEAKRLLSGTSVRIESDPTQGALDKYDRTLAYVYLADGTLFNRYMIAEGFGHEYTYNLPYRYQSEFKAAEVTARSSQKGLWAPEACAFTTAPAVVSPIQLPSGTSVQCSYNAYDCSHFSSQAEAQRTYEMCGGVTNDIHHLDEDHDGTACETLP